MTKEMHITIRDARQRDLDAAAVLERHGEVFHAARLRQSAADFEFLLTGQYPVSSLDAFAGELLTAHRLMPDVVDNIQFFMRLLSEVFADGQTDMAARRQQVSQVETGYTPSSAQAPEPDYGIGEEPLPRDVIIEQLRREQAQYAERGQTSGDA